MIKLKGVCRACQLKQSVGEEKGRDQPEWLLQSVYKNGEVVRERLLVLLKVQESWAVDEKIWFVESAQNIGGPLEKILLFEELPRQNWHTRWFSTAWPRLVGIFDSWQHRGHVHQI